MALVPGPPSPLKPDVPLPKTVFTHFELEFQTRMKGKCRKTATQWAIERTLAWRTATLTHYGLLNC